MEGSQWREEISDGLLILRPRGVPPGVLVAFSGRGVAPPGTPSPTAFLSRRFAGALSLPEIPIVRATQVHGRSAARVREGPPAASVRDAGECDVLATDVPDVALAVQTADCVSIVLAGDRAAALAHAGWRGSAENVAAAAVEAIGGLGEDPRRLRAWLGPSIGPCCYEVGPEVSSRFPAAYSQRSDGGRFLLDLRAVNRAQLESAGVRPENVLVHPACTRCGGERFASFRRDGAASGRMIALVARLQVRRSTF